ncbi:hypothetical protein [Aequorivita vladivostokensis]|uniref:Sperm nuclear basic protein PL-I n=1 Tax=Aequorivita vladivostokensis TaxID=171194 RepID=A0ABR5DKC4_9FLAO|nr:hypothetical protein [Aequorivita vladivostokensis]KJJ39227.1 hypothetical protein MB09_02960 [Aequorivita vladivostokensis]
MKNIAFIFSILLMGFSANATTHESEDQYRRGYDGSAYIFVEGDVEFSVFPDGQFDFVYVGPQKGSSVTINTPNVNISFNSGYDYDAYVQYDDYGAVIQVESVPIYYDYYGRIIQAGNVDIQYNDRRVVRVGGLHVIYNNRGHFSHATGIINVYNPYYVYRPWHVYYAPPIFTHCVVYDLPYRRYYSPVRYSYHDHVVYYKKRHHVAYHNGRRDFYRPGSRVYDKKGRASVNKNFDPNRKNTMVATSNPRSNSSIRTNSSVRNNNARGSNNVRSNNSRVTSEGRSNNTRRETVSRNRSTNSKGAAAIDRSKRNDRNYSSKSTRNTVHTRNSDNAKVSSNRNNVKNTRSENVVRSSNKRSVSNNKTVQRQTRTTPNNRSTSISRNKAQAPKRETASRSRNTVNKSSAPSRNSSKAKTSRGSSSREASSRGGRG